MHKRFVFLLGLVVFVMLVTPFSSIKSSNFQFSGFDNAFEPSHGKPVTLQNPYATVVNPCAFYSSEPAPMGIADYGVGPNNSPYSYNTTSFLGSVNISSLQVSGSNGDSMTFQLNVNLKFGTAGGNTYVYWIQDVAFVDTSNGPSSGEIQFIDNVWNMSSVSANMLPSSITGNGTVSSTSGGYYYDVASSSLPGNLAFLTYPSSLKLKVVSYEKDYEGILVPAVAFMYNDGYGWQTYDNVRFQFATSLSYDNGFVVSGYQYNPYGTFYDAELIMGGPGGGSSTTDLSSNLDLSLEFNNGFNYQEITNAYDFGSDTAETISNVDEFGSYHISDGQLFLNAVNGFGELSRLYSSAFTTWMAILSSINDGYLYINYINVTQFFDGYVNVTLAPGTYSFEIWNPETDSFIPIGNGSITLHSGHGQIYNVDDYPVTFLSNDLPSGSAWYVNITEANGTTYVSGPISQTSYSVYLANGSYTYTIATSDHTYKPSASSGSFSVHGSSPSTIDVTFSEVKYTVTFTETGLPSGSTWYVNLSNGQTFSSTTGTISFSLTNGTYTYTIATSDHIYKPSAYSGSFEVHGTEVSKNIIFSPVKYSVTFTESNLGPGTEWYVNITESNGTIYDSGAISGSSYTLNLANGSYTYSVSTSDHIYKPSVSSGSFIVDGSPLSESVIFTEVTYPVTFKETGLPSGTSWTLIFDGHRYTLTNTSYIFFEPNGTYSYSATSANYKNLTGFVTVNSSSQSVILSFVLQTYSVTFSEIGLPSGTTWYVNITESNGTVYDSGAISGSSYSFSLTNGSYTYTISTSDHTYKPSVSSGSFSVNGAAVSKSVTFSEVKYIVTFTESGLPSGSTWYVNLSNGQTFSSTTGIISFSEPNGTYSYTISTSDHTYKPSAYSGSFKVNGSSPVIIAVAFKEVTYSVTFTESGLPTGATWYVNLSNGMKSGPITGTSYSFSLTNGSYTYTIATSDKTYKPLSSSGSLTVNGTPLSKSVSFSEVKYTVTFTESGLSSGTSWSVTLNGTTLSSTTSTITFSEPNGTYSYTIGNVPGYNISKSSDSITASGKNVTQSITFSSVPSTTPPPKKPSTPTSNIDLYIIIGAVAAVAVVGAVVTIMIRKRK